MSDTPKTDELAKREFVTDGVWIRHARELERENAALRAHAERVGEANDRLVVENAALRADKERLDWMQRVKLTVLHHKGKVFGRGVKVPSTRQAIDAAMKEGK